MRSTYNNDEELDKLKLYLGANGILNDNELDTIKSVGIEEIIKCDWYPA